MRDVPASVGGVFSPILSRRFVIILATVCLPPALITGSACGASKSATKPSAPQNETAEADELTALRQKAAAGDALAQNQVGLTYLTGFYASEDLKGLHLTKDEAHAAQWFRKAAEQGLPEAQNQLGAMEDGKYIEHVVGAPGLERRDVVHDAKAAATRDIGPGADASGWARLTPEPHPAAVTDVLPAGRD